MNEKIYSRIKLIKVFSLNKLFNLNKGLISKLPKMYTNDKRTVLECPAFGIDQRVVSLHG
jgi:hypothetical protein